MSPVQRCRGCRRWGWHRPAARRMVTGGAGTPRDRRGRRRQSSIPALPTACLLASTAGSASLLLASPVATADVTFPRMLLALVPLAALVVLEHRSPTMSRRVVLGVGTGLLVLAVVRPPHGSHDVWSYAMYGRMAAVHHVSPYTHRPAEFLADPFLAPVSPGWRSARSVYGPGFTALSTAIMVVAGSSALLARLGFQAVAAGAVLGAGAVLFRLGASARTLAAVLLNPLLVVSVANGGHNDALVGLAILLTAVALHRRRPAVAGFLLAGAVLVKAVAVLPAVAAVLWVWRHHGRRQAATVAGCLGGAVAVGYAAAGGLAAIAPVFAAGARRSRVSVWNLLAGGHLAVLSPMTRHAGVVAAVVVIGFTVVVVATRIGEESVAPVLVASLVGYLLLAGYVLPWYFAWILPLAAIEDASALARVLAAQTVVVLVAYQYQSIRHRDRLDRLLQVGVAGARVVAVVGALVLLTVAVTTSRRLTKIPS